MKRIARFFLPPIFVLAASTWLIYDHWIAPDPQWRFPKAEAAGPLLLLVGVGALVYSVLAFIRTSRPITPGMSVMFDGASGPLVGSVVTVDASSLVVRTTNGDFRIERDAISDIV